jgi:hypothetical protein
MLLNLKRLDDYDRSTDWIRPLARGQLSNISVIMLLFFNTCYLYIFKALCLQP